MKCRTTLSLVALLVASSLPLPAQSSVTAPYDSIAREIVRTGLGQDEAIGMLRDLCINVGPRLTGSPGAAKGVAWAVAKMKELGFQNVHTEPVMVPHWLRGPVEEASYMTDASSKPIALHIAALGGSVATPKKGLTAEIIEITSWDQLKAIGDRAKGKIVFFNRPMDRSLISTGQAYGRAVDQRGRGAVEAAKVGGIAALVRSMSTRIDLVPHTGMMTYVDSIPKVPAAAVSTQEAETLHRLLADGHRVTVSLTLSCEMLPDVESANVMGEIVGSEKPDEVVVVGGHLDSWDKGQGAHDDGAGCVQSMEALRLLKTLGLTPKRTIRAVLFMNEEDGLNGGIAYAAKDRGTERTVAAIETDSGGFLPLGFGISDSAAYGKLSQYAPLFRPFFADHFQRGGGGADISPMAKKHVPMIGLITDWNPYFDLHHSDSDVVTAVNERQLELGAVSLAILTYVIAQEGL